MRHRIIFLWLSVLMVLPSPAWALTPNDGLLGNQWYLEKIQARAAWDTTQGSASVIVAVLDSGVDIDHEDLVNNIYINTGEVKGDGIDNDGNGFIDDVNGWDFYDRDANPRPELTGNPAEIGVHHGTVIAGLVGAEGNNNRGVAGVGWRITILPVRVLNTDGDGTFATIVSGMDYAVAQGADVINLSFVGELDAPQLREALARAYDAGVVVVAALGNTNGGRDLDVDPLYPACSSWTDRRNIVIGVSATDPNDTRAEFSNYGRNCADLAAPGEGMFTILMSRAGLGHYGGGWNGTSLAAPLVAGAAALVRSLFPSMSPAKILSALQLSADPILGLNPKGQRGTLGAGRLNVDRALEVATQLATTADTMMPEAPRHASTTPVSPTAAGLTSGGGGLRPFAVGAALGDPGRVETSDGVASSGRSWFPYGESFRGGVFVAVGQLDDDAGYEIITAPGAGGGPHIKVFSEAGILENEFFAYDKAFRGGVSVAAADVDGDGIDEIVTAPGAGAPSVVKFHRATGALMNTIALDFDGTTQVFVAAGDLDGDGADDIVVTDDSGEPRVFVYRLYGTQQTSFLATTADRRGALHADVWEGTDGKRFVVTRMPSSHEPFVRFFSYIGAFVGQFDSNAVSGDNGDVAVWRPYADRDPFIVTSERADGPDLFVYDRLGGIGSIQLFLEQAYAQPVRLAQ